MRYIIFYKIKENGYVFCYGVISYITVDVLNKYFQSAMVRHAA